MSSEHSTKENQRTVATLPLLAIGTVAIAAAAFFAFPTWSAMPGEPMAGRQDASAAGAQEATKLAHEHDTWLREAHGKANRSSDAQDLPAQF